MNVYYINNLNNLPDLEANSCAIGNFDGIHIGHRKLIENTKKHGIKTLVVTFENINKHKYLTNLDQKIKYLEDLGVDYLVIFPFEVIKMVFFNEFIDVLKQLKVKHITCGADFRFGYKREGDILDLKKKFKLEVYEDVVDNQTRISTSLIKELISDGLIGKANELLEKPYSIKAIVVEGNKIGRKLGYPTANLDYKDYILPKNGVYLSLVNYKDTKYLAMTNIGYNPTLNEQASKRLEVHILGFNQEIYGEEIEVSFIKFLREEKKYNTKDELIKSLDETINICLEYESMIK